MTDNTYKYVTLKNRQGEYLIPYCGMPEFADIALSGDFNDLKNIPEIPSPSKVAYDTDVVHIAGAETISGQKGFSGAVNLGTSAVAETKPLTNNSQAVSTTAFVTEKVNAYNGLVEDAINKAIEAINAEIDN